MINKSDVTIIIPTLDTERNAIALTECFSSLKESEFPVENIVVVFNNIQLPVQHHRNNTVGSRHMLLEEQGQCKAVNAAAATVNTRWIMVSNDDMIYPPNWFEKLVTHRAKNQFSIDLEHFDGCISPQLIEPIDGAPTFKKYFCGGVGGDFDKKKFLEYAKTHEGEGIRSGFNLPFLIKKEVWDMVGGYDVNYDVWSSNSDSDLEYKLKLAGIDMYQNTNCPVYHFGQTSGTFLPENRGYWQKNWDYFIDKWGFPRTDEGIWEATFTIPYDKLKYKPKWMKLPGEEPV